MAKRLQAVNQEAQFELASLSDAQLRVLNICRALAKLPPYAGEGPAAIAQAACLRSDYQRCIAVLALHLNEQGALPRRPDRVNGLRFAELRRLQDIAQGEVASALGVSQSALSQFESGKSRLALPKLLLAAEIIGVPLQQFVGWRTTGDV